MLKSQELKTGIDDLQRLLAEDLPKKAGFLGDTVAQLFSRPGKMLRPTLSLAVAILTSPDRQIKANHLELAQVCEMIHLASLLHDDVLDQSNSRRGHQSLRVSLGDKAAILIGDFLFAHSSLKLSEIAQSDISRSFANVLIDLCNGEVKQAQESYNQESLSWENYYTRIKGKTASLFATSAEAAAILNHVQSPIQKAMRLYGESLGIAFQMMDDLFDFTISQEQLGKPVWHDLQSGIYTAPILFALEHQPTKGGLKKLLDKELMGKNETLLSIESLLKEAQAFEKTETLAKEFALKAKQTLSVFPESHIKEDLLSLAELVVSRKK